MIWPPLATSSLAPQSTLQPIHTMATPDAELAQDGPVLRDGTESQVEAASDADVTDSTDSDSTDNEASEPARVSFPPTSRAHIIHCSYPYWHNLWVFP